MLFIWHRMRWVVVLLSCDTNYKILYFWSWLQTFVFISQNQPKRIQISAWQPRCRPVTPEAARTQHASYLSSLQRDAHFASVLVNFLQIYASLWGESKLTAFQNLFFPQAWVIYLHSNLCNRGIVQTKFACILCHLFPFHHIYILFQCDRTFDSHIFTFYTDTVPGLRTHTGFFCGSSPLWNMT